MPEYDDVCAVVPTFNESETIGDVVDGLQAAGIEDVLVVDGHSGDGTAEIAEEHDATVVMQSGTGKGQAVRQGVSEADASNLVMLDGDGTYLPEQVDRLLEPLLAGDAEHVIGDRFADMDADAMTGLNKFGNRVINRAFSRIHGQEYGDILSGYRAFTRESFEKMYLTAEGFGIETEMAVECARHNLPTAVVPITYLPRPEGSETNLHPIADGARILMTLYGLAKTSNPLFYFGSVGSLSAVVGLLVASYVGFEWFVQGVSHEVLAVVAAAGVLFGVQLLMFGLLADLIVSLHRETIRRIEDQ